MVTLKDFDEIKERLKTSKKHQVDALHKFIFENVGDRNNRQRLRNFSGFEYDKNDPRFISKIEYVNKELNEMDLLSVCLLLGINHDTQNLKVHVFENLSQDTLLIDLVEDCENDEEEVVTEEDEEDALNGENQGSEVIARHRLDNDTLSLTDTDNKLNLKPNSGQNRPKFSINFRDIEDSIRPFSGNDVMPVGNWIQEFEEIALLMNLKEFQKMIIAKNVLTGNAKLFIMSERNLNTWHKLRDALLNKFSRKMNSAQLHKILGERQMK